MSKSGRFDIELFFQLSGAALVRYMERCMESSEDVSEEDLRTIVGELGRLESHKLVFAIELAARRRPALIAEQLPSLICHEKQFVRLAATRALRQLKHVPRSLLEEIIAMASRCPEDITVELDLLRTRVL